jgi:hypothetical protein
MCMETTHEPIRYCLYARKSSEAVSKNINCKEGYIEEKVLINQLTEIVDQIDLDSSGIKKKLEVEIERHKKFHSGIIGKTDESYSLKMRISVTMQNIC